MRSRIHHALSAFNNLVILTFDLRVTHAGDLQWTIRLLEPFALRVMD